MLEKNLLDSAETQRKNKHASNAVCLHRMFTMLIMIVLVLFSYRTITLAETFNWPELDTLQTSVYLVADLDSGDIILSHQADQMIYPASTTKIMTALLLIESGQLDKQTVVSEAAVDLDYDMARTGFLAGEKVVLEDVLYSLLLVSGNDSARITAEYLAGDTAAFASLMNSRAAELGLKQTNFVNPSGLHDPEHVTTAADMLQLTRYAMRSEHFRSVVDTEKYVMPATNLHPYHAWAVLKNSNELLHFGELAYASPYYRAYSGIKTGTTRAAGYCLVASALTHDDRELVLLLFGVPTDEPRSYLYQAAFSLFQAAAEQEKLPQATPSPQPTSLPVRPEIEVTESGEPDVSTEVTHITREEGEETEGLTPSDQSSESGDETNQQTEETDHEELQNQLRFWQSAFAIMLLISLGAGIWGFIYYKKKMTHIRKK